MSFASCNSFMNFKYFTLIFRLYEWLFHSSSNNGLERDLLMMNGSLYAFLFFHVFNIQQNERYFNFISNLQLHQHIDLFRSSKNERLTTLRILFKCERLKESEFKCTYCCSHNRVSLVRYSMYLRPAIPMVTIMMISPTTPQDIPVIRYFEN